MKIVITGANGFVGASLCRYFANKGYQVIATGRQHNPNVALFKYAEYIQADITHKLKNFDADVCIHAAGLATDSTNRDQLYLNNVIGTQNVISASGNCKLLVFISSSSVYNFKNGEAAEEDCKADESLSPYGISKRLAEDVIIKYNDTYQNRMILRPRAIYGIGDRILLPRLLNFVKGDTMLCPVNGSIKTAATHIKNLAYAIELFLHQQNKPPLQIYNVADNIIYGLKELIINLLRSVCNKNLKVLNIPPQVLNFLVTCNNFLRISDILGPVALNSITQSSVLNISLIKKNLGYDPVYNFDNSIAEIKEWIVELGGWQNYRSLLKDVPWLNQ